MLAGFVVTEEYEEAYPTVSQRRGNVTKGSELLHQVTNKTLRISTLSTPTLLGMAGPWLWAALTSDPQTKKAALRPRTIWTMENPAFKANAGGSAVNTIWHYI